MKIYKRIISNITILGFIFSTILYINTYGQSIGCIKGNNVNLRSNPSKNAEVITKLNKEQFFQINDFEDDFFKINIDGKEGYIFKDFVDIFKVECEIIKDSINVREFPSEESQIIGKLSNLEKVFVTGKKDFWYLIEFNGACGFVNKNCISTKLEKFIKDIDTTNYKEPIKIKPNDNILDVLDIDNNWVKVSYNDECNSYVSADYISSKTNLLDIEENNKNNVKDSNYNIISYAKNFLGTPYSWGGTNLTEGVDCSGFVYSVFKNFGIDLYRSSSDMIKNGENISKDQLKKGDLVFFNTTGFGISHVGIYIDNGNFIHSSSKRKQGVCINNLNEGYYQKSFVGATRIL